MGQVRHITHHFYWQLLQQSLEDFHDIARYACHLRRMKLDELMQLFDK